MSCIWDRRPRQEPPSTSFLLPQVNAMAVTPWGDIWTGSSSGSVRIWAYSHDSMGERGGSKVTRSKHILPDLYLTPL